MSEAAEFLPRCMQCGRGLAMRILPVCLSVCPSVKRVICDKIEEKSVFQFCPKLTQPAARSLCDNWASCICRHSLDYSIPLFLRTHLALTTGVIGPIAMGSARFQNLGVTTWRVKEKKKRKMHIINVTTENVLWILIAEHLRSWLW